ncbi:MAG: CIA30 family protein [Anaerolineales bacterium]|nr:CIA30 family protein [Anaerolineales bacterium]
MMVEKEKAQVLFDFLNPKQLEGWRIVNDGVMGGLSRSEIVFSDRGSILFQGTLSLENAGGFASVQAEAPPINWKKFAGLLLRIRGDGRRYQLRLRTDQPNQDLSYRAYFDTHPGKWIEVSLPFEAFQPVSRGQVLDDAPPLTLEMIARIGFLLADQQAGEFKLETDWIKAYA